MSAFPTASEPVEKAARNVVIAIATMATEMRVSARLAPFSLESVGLFFPRYRFMVHPVSSP